MKSLVIALGGNALGKDPKEQLKLVKNTSKIIVDLVEEGYKVIVSHGNGPQVGVINLAMDFSSNNGGNTPSFPFAECGAMSQGYIGYHLQQAIKEELNKRSIKMDVVSLITQVIVDKKDEAFLNPTKPVGIFYSKEEAKKISEEKGYKFIEDSNRGYRRVVPSPKPQEILEADVIKKLSKECIVIAVGGGGIPVIKEENSYIGVDAVIDKDKSSCKLAIDLGVDTLLILTVVENVYINYNEENQKVIDTMDIDLAKEYVKEGYFAKGSMLPKIEACIEFVENNKNSKAIITSLEKAKEALNGYTGTRIINR
ncbi:carbamate kinase [[Clostridium] sordellii]|uniref:Carbamate kinase n=1 Tax=Paraclostridium sordellii TaxID=1505 RepID=A0ABM9RLF1_PARSO|nr:carbamate kinase [Paeniclostridium sordellii]EPZ55243.1 carbamate kinase [[Clostridium] sordellii ATCC 9714] [Paeniclostridium sordellii ATCC 9714]CEJ72832.1 carbamate kinase [[Clostridium] sordellii] [Paeniclostridium sordellii]CEN68385.1 carbamate kinase [[Clostridium] sordellii] [Paeniclostridium sordellii]CEN71652.1 carbamate kinase [[Clostridium] sordellii] [Paeniclostridium sordellii]CEO22021.1 carbamate kinase [[Clostridium] sordellii] [Paeniclostridium sordellii]